MLRSCNSTLETRGRMSLAVCDGLTAIPTGTTSMSVDVGCRKYYNLHQSVNRTSKNLSRRTSSVLVDGAHLQETGRADNQSKTCMKDLKHYLYVKRRPGSSHGPLTFGQE